MLLAGRAPRGDVRAGPRGGSGGRPDRWRGGVRPPITSLFSRTRSRPRRSACCSRATTRP